VQGRGGTATTAQVTAAFSMNEQTAAVPSANAA
jgi:hypothetical protein